MTISNERLRLHSTIISVFDTNIQDIKAMASELLQARDKIAELEKAYDHLELVDEGQCTKPVWDHVVDAMEILQPEPKE